METCEEKKRVDFFYSLYPTNSSMFKELLRLFPNALSNRNSCKPLKETEENYLHLNRDEVHDPSGKLRQRTWESRKVTNKYRQMFCVFCKKNGEDAEFCENHMLRDKEGRVVCPVLRAYNCPICNNQGGDYAHTVSYCPQRQNPISTVATLNTKRTSVGKRRW
ncbi:nanos homolog 3-like [Tachypleus tridentatus]|uniref:nanos homolog 3-like n=1 Tax=Tachypleus tridentatus TaxID=6853 RepID=UPI003FCFDC64